MNTIVNENTSMKILYAPASKSFSHRYLLCAGLSKGRTRIENLLDAEDITATKGCLQSLGIQYEEKYTGCLEVYGVGGNFHFSERDPFYVHNSATLSRILPIILSSKKGTFCIESEAQLSKRSHKELFPLLKQCNASIQFSKKEGYPPFSVTAHGIVRDFIEIKQTSSSQYISGLLIVAPLLNKGLSIYMNPKKIPSFPYVVMTLLTLQDFSIPFRIEDIDSGKSISLDDLWNLQKQDSYTTDICIHVKTAYFQSGEYSIPSDWSNISYLVAIGLLGKEKIAIEGSFLKSYQGDSDILGILRSMGGEIEEKGNTLLVSPSRLTAIDIDMHRYPDIVPTLAILLAFSKGKGTLYSIGTLRTKETDRISAMTKVLSTLGVFVEEGKDSITIEGTSKIEEGKHVATYNDHRIAMACGIVKAIGIDIEIENMECVRKSYPTFWEDIGIEVSKEY